MTCALVSAPGRACIDAIPIPAESNEVGHFQAAFKSLIGTYGGLFDVVSYDAGGFSRKDADAVVAAGKDYLFALKDEHRTMRKLADELLASEAVVDLTEEPRRASPPSSCPAVKAGAARRDPAQPGGGSSGSAAGGGRHAPVICLAPCRSGTLRPRR